IFESEIAAALGEAGVGVLGLGIIGHTLGVGAEAARLVASFGLGNFARVGIDLALAFSGFLFVTRLFLARSLTFSLILRLGFGGLIVRVARTLRFHGGLVGFFKGLLGGIAELGIAGFPGFLEFIRGLVLNLGVLLGQVLDPLFDLLG